MRKSAALRSVYRQYRVMGLLFDFCLLGSGVCFCGSHSVQTPASFLDPSEELTSVLWNVHRNVEVQHSIEDLIELAQTHPRENLDVQLDEQSISSFRGHYSNAMYQVRSTTHFKA